MNQEQIRTLTTMKKLIKQGKYKFAKRRDIDYVQELALLGITEEEAWNDHILSLNNAFYYPDPKPNYLTSGKTLVFRKPIKGHLVYIKLKLEKDNNEDYTVCLSFHKSRRVTKYEMRYL